MGPLEEVNSNQPYYHIYVDNSAYPGFDEDESVEKFQSFLTVIKIKYLDLSQKAEKLEITTLLNIDDGISRVVAWDIPNCNLHLKFHRVRFYPFLRHFGEYNLLLTKMREPRLTLVSSLKSESDLTEHKGKSISEEEEVRLPSLNASSADFSNFTEMIQKFDESALREGLFVKDFCFYQDSVFLSFELGGPYLIYFSIKDIYPKIINKSNYNLK